MQKISQTTAIACLDYAVQIPELAGFAYFNVDLSAAVDPQTGEPFHPQMRGNTDLWQVEPTPQTGVVLDLERAMRETAQRERESRVEQYRLNVERTGSVWPTDEGDDTPQEDEDEWSHFWGGQAPTEVGYVKRARIERSPR